MSQFLPNKELEFGDVELEDVLKTADDNEEGYVLEVDLLVLDELHDKLKEFPPCPEIMASDPDLLSDYQKK